MAVAKTKRLDGIFRQIGYSKWVFARAFLPSLKILIPLAIFSFAFTTTMSLSLDGSIVVIALVLFILFSFYAAIVTMYIIDSVYRREKIDFKKLLPTSRKNFWKFFIVKFLTALIIIIGYLLFIIPGIFLSVRYAFTGFVALFEKKSIGDTMDYGFELTHGYWWALFGRFVILGFLISVLYVLIISALLYVGSLLAPITSTINSGIILNAITSFVSPFVGLWITSFYYVLYRDIAKKSVTI
ncbi:hypothetical protein HYV44_00115 [Candidatus Microgenomates bacterium]|nr:hypothetical protein [Candidatus Microgenomates bacterium]